MATIVGTNDLSSLLAIETGSVLDVGTENVAAALQADLDAWNGLVRDAVSFLAEPTTERIFRDGEGDSGTMEEADEYSQGIGKKVSGGGNLGVPLRKHQRNVGWTLDALKVATPADLARQYIAVRTAHQKAIYTRLRQALFTPTNATVADKLVDRVDLPVKALINADGFPIDTGPNGESFNSATHTHYDANATLTAATIDALVTDVLEHTNDGNIQLIISETNAATVQALTGFVALSTALIQSDGAGIITTQRLETTRTSNRVIGYWRGAYPIWVKPWGVANYMLAVDANRRPLAFRERENAALRGLRLVQKHEHSPLVVDFMEAEFGLAVRRRTAAAVLQFNNGTYSAPSV
jgi:hypothetical protein